MIARFAIIVVFGVVGVSNAQKKNARLTNYCSFPPCCNSNPKPPYTAAEKKYCPGNAECEDYNGCKWEGQFAFCGKKSHQWVIDNNIAAFWSKNSNEVNKYKNKKLRITQGSKSIDVTVCDTCSDSDCDNCCTKNAGSTGYLIDLESNTMARFGGSDGAITWECLNC